jgi:hypothetical protein
LGSLRLLSFQKLKQASLAARMCFVLCCRNVDVTITHGAL